MMLCEECREKSATVHLIQVVNGQKSESHLCSDCAALKGGFSLGSEYSFSIPNLLGGMFGAIQGLQDKPAQAKVTACPTCGMSFKDIRRLGKLGCSECYSTYSQEMEATLRRIHGTTRHIGKVPLRGGEKVLVMRQIDNLRNSLLEAVKEEQYERAAAIRDQLKDMERQLSAEGRKV